MLENIRIHNTYFDETNVTEINRLRTQIRLLNKFDRTVTNHIKEIVTPLTVLDLGCNTGEAVIDRFGLDDMDFYCGLDINETVLARAKARYKNLRTTFFLCDLEKTFLREQIQKECRPYGYQQFTVIYLSMVLLHMKDPLALLKTCYELLAPNGVIFIRDIDDGLNLAYPDKQGFFNKCFRIANYSPTAGYRHSGRQIPTYLLKLGYKNVLVEKQGLDTTVCSSPEDREALYDTYFLFLPEDSQKTAEANPRNKEILQDFHWLKKSLKELKAKFLQPQFYFNLGFMTITATK